MAYEREQDLPMLNRQTLIGCTDQRGDAWHRRDDLMGEQSNHYLGHIPTEDVISRLFDWEPVHAEVAYLVPIADDSNTTVFDETVITKADGRRYRVVETTDNRVGVLHSGTDADLGVFKAGVQHFPYRHTLIREAERLTGTTLGISSAGCLGRGERAWVEFSMEETLHDPLSGLDYRPNLVKADSMDGSLAMTTFLSSNITICANTLTWNLNEASASGRLYKRKHTSGLGDDLQDERDALGLLERVDETFRASVRKLIEMEVTREQRIEVMDIIVPEAPEGSSARGITIAQNKREALLALESDPMVAQWIGTGWGEVQKYNTWQTWVASRRSGSRWEANTWRDLSGKTAESDRQVVGALNAVLAV